MIETEKMRNLSGKQHKTSSTQEHAPGWNEYLATSAEAAVKADKVDADVSPDVLQKRSVEHILARHHEDDVSSGTVEARYERDEVEGPLRGASAVKETLKVKKDV